MRCFDRTVGGEVLDFYLKVPTSVTQPDGSRPLRLVDAQTGSEWDFSGKAVSGPLAGRELRRVQTLKDFWFDWQLYHPQTRVYSAGL